MIRALVIGCWSMSVLLASMAAIAADDASSVITVSRDAVQFAVHHIGTFRSEACCVGDFNNDGKLDIVAGPYLYLAPEWKPQKIRELDGNPIRSQTLVSGSKITLPSVVRTKPVGRC